jgi:hypothetical protein
MDRQISSHNAGGHKFAGNYDSRDPVYPLVGVYLGLGR